MVDADPAFFEALLGAHRIEKARCPPHMAVHNSAPNTMHFTRRGVSSAHASSNSSPPQAEAVGPWLAVTVASAAEVALEREEGAIASEAQRVEALPPGEEKVNASMPLERRKASLREKASWVAATRQLGIAAAGGPAPYELRRREVASLLRPTPDKAQVEVILRSVAAAAQGALGVEQVRRVVSQALELPLEEVGSERPEVLAFLARGQEAPLDAEALCAAIPAQLAPTQLAAAQGGLLEARLTLQRAAVREVQAVLRQRLWREVAMRVGRWQASAVAVSSWQLGRECGERAGEEEAQLEAQLLAPVPKIEHGVPEIEYWDGRRSCWLRWESWRGGMNTSRWRCRSANAALT
jgi:hypothetical protein